MKRIAVYPKKSGLAQGNSTGLVFAYPLRTYGTGEALLSPSAGPAGRGSRVV
ncbi:hypothetical protein TNCV_2553981 [Trichonephila clavipes]|nr:hypothetical protein TNCV_2553981 [Trichonephila clavipes]